MISWGLIACAMALVRSETGFYVMRLLLGIAEAGFFPGIILYLTYWFPAASARASSPCSWPRCRSPRCSAGRCPARCSRCTAFSGWPAGTGCSSSRACRPSCSASLRCSCSPTSRRRRAGSPTDERQALDGHARGGSRDDEGGRLCRHRRGADAAAGAGAGPALFPHGDRALRHRLLDAASDPDLRARRRSRSASSRRSPICSPPSPWCFGGGTPTTRTSGAGTSRCRCSWRRRPSPGRPIRGRCVPTMIALTLATLGFYAAFGPFWSLPTALLTGTGAAAGIALVNSMGNAAGFAGPYIVGRVEAGDGQLLGGAAVPGRGAGARRPHGAAVPGACEPTPVTMWPQRAGTLPYRFRFESRGYCGGSPCQPKCPLGKSGSRKPGAHHPPGFFPRWAQSGICDFAGLGRAPANMFPRPRLSPIGGASFWSTPCPETPASAASTPRTACAWPKRPRRRRQRLTSRDWPSAGWSSPPTSK